MPLRGCRKTGPLHSLYQTHWSRRCHPALCNVPLTPAPSPSPTFCQDLFICICHLKKDHLIKFSPAGMGIVQIRWKSCWSCCRKSVSLPQLCSIECSSIIATCSSTLVLPPPPSHVRSILYGIELRSPGKMLLLDTLSSRLTLPCLGCLIFPCAYLPKYFIMSC
jgi:hypothetical protein